VKPLSAASLILFMAFIGTPAQALLSPTMSFAPDEPMDIGVNVDECSFPEPPTIPNGETAPESELAGAGAAVRRYQTSMQDSLACIEGVIESLGEDITRKQDAGLTALYNNGVEQLVMIAESFNQQVRTFKARQAAQSAE